MIFGKVLGKHVGNVAETMVKSEYGKEIISQTASGIVSSTTNGVLDKQGSQQMSGKTVRVSGRIESKRLDKE